MHYFHRNGYAATALSNRSLAHLKLGLFEKALNDADECAKIRPDWSKPYFRRGEVYSHLGRWSEAELSYELAVRCDPNDASLEPYLRTARERAQSMPKSGKRDRGEIVLDLTRDDVDLNQTDLISNGVESQPEKSDVKKRGRIQELTGNLYRSNDSAHACPQDSTYAVFLNKDEAVEENSEQELLRVLQFAMAEEHVGQRSFSLHSVEQFFENIANRKVKVVGFSEFSYSKCGTADGELVEREYWVKVTNEALHVIVHVHYKGLWSPFKNRRDRSVITSINLRHAVPKRNPSKVPVFPLICKAFGSWREKHKYKISVDPPWDWMFDSTRFTHLQSLLIEAENCTRRVRSLDSESVPLKIPKPGGAKGARHALILAVNDYAPPAPSLENPIRDATNLQEALIDLGWQVRLPCAPHLREPLSRTARNAPPRPAPLPGHVPRKPSCAGGRGRCR